MLSDENKNSRFPHEILRAFKVVDAGQADVFVMDVTIGKSRVDTVTVGGVWIGDVFSWRVVPGRHATVSADMGEEIFGGMGDEDDAAKAAIQFGAIFTGVAVADWSIDV